MDFSAVLKFKKEQKALDEQEEQEQGQLRKFKKKNQNPQANLRDYDKENEIFGSTNEVDLILQRINGLP